MEERGGTGWVDVLQKADGRTVPAKTSSFLELVLFHSPKLAEKRERMSMLHIASAVKAPCNFPKQIPVHHI